MNARPARHHATGEPEMAAGLSKAADRDDPLHWRDRRVGPEPGAGASNPRRQVGEAAVAGQHGFELGKLLVAPVVAAAFDQLARRG